MKNNHNDTAEMISKLFFRLLPIQVLIIAMGAINSIVDGSVAGQFINSTTVGVVGLYYTMVNVLNAIGNTILGGTTVLCGKYMGSGDLNKTKGIFSLNILLTTIIGLVLTVISFLFANPLASFLGASEELRPALMTYIVGFGVGILPLLLSQQLASFLQLERQSTRGYIGIAAMIISNVVADIVFVAILKWGVLGLALATSFSNWIYFIILGQYYFTKKAQLTFHKDLIQTKELIPLITIGVPGAMLVLCLALRGLVLNRILLNIAGNDGLSAMSAYNMVSGIFLAYCLGAGAVARMLTSVFIGEEDPNSIKQLFKTIYTKGMITTIIIAIIIILSSGLITRIFFPDPSSNVYHLTQQLMIIYGACIPLILICCVNTNYLQAFGHKIYVNILSIFDGFFAMIIPTLLLTPILGVLGIWLAGPIGIILTALLTPLYCMIYWKRIPQGIDEWLFFPKDFGADENERLDIHINDLHDVTKTAELVQAFCKERHMSEKTSYYSALCLEEMAGNVVEHGFHKDNKKHSVDVHVVHKDETITLRIKDDCIPFNPEERANMTNSDDPIKNIGIRMVLKIADDVSYQNLLGLNVSTIQINNK